MEHVHQLILRERQLMAQQLVLLLHLAHASSQPRFSVDGGRQTLEIQEDNLMNTTTHTYAVNLSTDTRRTSVTIYVKKVLIPKTSPVGNVGGARLTFMVVR